jgi:hypothetical protein
MMNAPTTTGAGVSIVDDLLANTGTYYGIDTVQQRKLTGASRVVVTALPGKVGVSLDYEILNPAFPEGVLGHIEHTVIGRSHSGGAVMVVADTHSGALSMLRESSPGVFDTSDEPLPYPMKVVVSVPEPGRIRHSWWYNRPGEAALEQDVSELTRVD